MITKKEAAVIETYTGICMLTGNDRKYIYEYAENLMGRPVYTHEFAYLGKELEEKSKSDFINLCKNIANSECNDVQPVVHAEWEEIKEYEHDKLPIVYECSECGYQYHAQKGGKFKHCPGCGAKMDEKELK